MTLKSQLREMSGEKCYEEQKRAAEEEELEKELSIFLEKHNAKIRRQL